MNIRYLCSIAQINFVQTAAGYVDRYIPSNPVTSLVAREYLDQL
jgi:hypothetical protein